MGRDRRLGWSLVALGLVGAAATQIVAPGATPPLYDGVIVVEPYVWLDPPPDGLGGAEGVADTVAVVNGQNDLVVIATTEVPPQAQVFGVDGSLELPAGATEVKVAISPVDSPGPAPEGWYIDGNVYRFDVTDQAGRPIKARADGQVTVVLRSADPLLTAGTIQRWDGSGWQAAETFPDFAAGFSAIVTDFGTFAVMVRGVSPYPTSLPSPTATAVPPTISPSAPTSTILGSAPPTGGPGQSSPGDSGGPALVVLAIAAAAFALLGVAWWRRRTRYDDRGWRR